MGRTAGVHFRAGPPHDLLVSVHSFHVVTRRPLSLPMPSGPVAGDDG